VSGYGGCDDESLHAIILGENGVHAARLQLEGAVVEYCLDCGELINPKRIAYARKTNMKCVRCVDCQQDEDRRPKSQIKMLTWIL
jgi:RNA polymerase-binding transcription factor DksA